MHFYDILAAYITIILLYMRAIGNNSHCASPALVQKAFGKSPKQNPPSQRSARPETGFSDRRPFHTSRIDDWFARVRRRIRMEHVRRPDVRAIFEDQPPRDHAKWYQNG